MLAVLAGIGYFLSPRCGADGRRKAFLDSPRAVRNSRQPGPVSTNTRSKTGKKRVLLVDDHPLLRLGIGHLVNQQPDLVVCGQAEDAAEALAGVARLKPDIVLLDLTLKDSDGMEALKDIRARHPKVPVLVLSVHSESIYAEMSLSAGAKGYVMKTEPLVDILLAIRRVLAGGIYLSEPVASRLLHQHARGGGVQASPIERLSDRERQVLSLLGQWQGTREIARQLHLSVKTVEHYREKLKEKLNLNSAAALVQYAVQWTQKPRRGQPGKAGPSHD